ncbi:cytochrome c1-2, heme protein, mitochondrial [Cinnamomum micranthum f. kanehirae]|uniref:Cytochrome c1-2, heme protein, mitochondrial n=1 Tax=Cinnamomum micranthum f. kanehirae TaxID=337451 RepID=A0A443N485_9MAGN|nr:cytochrome c1-2, heme protein, mitochondrial [Cinnamomum micranthum f. kanehirae]
MGRVRVRTHEVQSQRVVPFHLLLPSLAEEILPTSSVEGEEETKAIAAETEVVDRPNDEARFANGGAYPPDLSLITKAQHNGQNYVFALLTSYRDPPVGVSVIFWLPYQLFQGPHI